MNPRSTITLVALLTAGMAACNRGSTSSPPNPQPPSSQTPTPTPPPPTPPPPPAPPPSLVNNDVAAPSGPRADFTAPNYTLAIALAPVTSPGDSTFSFELHGTPGFHVNELFPIAIDLELTNATAAKTQLRRADAAEFSQAVARFALPVHTTGAAATVRGTARFAVCSDSNCVPETRRFAVVIP